MIVAEEPSRLPVRAFVPKLGACVHISSGTVFKGLELLGCRYSPAVRTRVAYARIAVKLL